MVENPTPPVVNADGTTDAGEPFFTISDSDQFVLAPGESTADVRIEFERRRDRFSYSLRVERDVVVVNRPPVANAGPDQTVLVGDTVTLNGGGSTDPDGDSLTFSWLLLTVPTGSQAMISDPASVTPTFVADRPGDYLAQLIVDDGSENSAPDTLSITTGNSPPVANAGPDQSVALGETAVLDGSQSSDVDGDPLTFTWSFFSRPPGSQAMLSDSTDVAPASSWTFPGPLFSIWSSTTAW